VEREMFNKGIPQEWELDVDPRYLRQNMEKAMRGKIERALVELITNADDSYRELEEQGKDSSGKIVIEIEKKNKGISKVKVKDRAAGMSREELHAKLGALGKRTSGFEKGKMRRGLHGRGSRDVAIFGGVHFESIKDNFYNHLYIPLSLKCRFINDRPIKADEALRKELGIPKGNGTVVTIEVQQHFRIPQFKKLFEDFSKYYSLRDIFSCDNREVILKDCNSGKTAILKYRYPIGKIIYDEDIVIPGYPDARAHLILKKHDTSFDQDRLPTREGVIVKSSIAIHDCTYFDCDSNPLAWRFSGILVCDYIDKLVREYDDREQADPNNPNHPENNSIRLLDPTRDGLIGEHPFVQALFKKCREILAKFIEELKVEESISRKDVANDDIRMRLNEMSKDISRLFEKKILEIDEESQGDEPKGSIKDLPIGLSIIPPGPANILSSSSKTFTWYVKQNEKLDEKIPLSIEISGDPNYLIARESKVYFKKFYDDQKVGSGTFTIDARKGEIQAIIEAKWSSFSKVIIVKTIDRIPSDEIPEGLSFEKEKYNIVLNREKTLGLRLKSNFVQGTVIDAIISSNNNEIIIKGGNKCKLRKNEDGVFIGYVRLIGRQLKAKAIISAFVQGYNQTTCNVQVEDKSRDSGINLEFEPIEEDFGALRYKWDEKKEYHLCIGAKHPSVKRYLGELNPDGVYSGINTPQYRAILAEIIAEALAFKLLEKQIKRDQGLLDYPSLDLYFHRNLSEFLQITHKYLNS